MTVLGSASTGATPSRTLTVKLPVAVLAAASVAEHCTVVTPKGNKEPDGGVHVADMGPSTLSTALAVYDTTMPPGPGSA